MGQTGTEQDFILKAVDVRFREDAEGHLTLEHAGRELAVASVTAAFPLTHRHGMIVLRGPDGKQLGILEEMDRLDPDSRFVVTGALERSYFMPRILDIRDIKEELNVVEWEVETNKGLRTFEVRDQRRNVRRIGGRRFVIKDVDGNRYEIPDWMDLHAHAQKLLEDYL